MAGERDVLAAINEALKYAVAATPGSLDDMQYLTFADHMKRRLAARGYTLSRSEPEPRPGREDEAYDAGRLAGFEEGLAAAPSPEPLPLDVERLARALGNWCRYRSESCDEPSPCSHDWSLAQTLFRDMAEPREPAP